MKGTLLANTALFRGTSSLEAEAMLDCLGASAAVPSGP